MKKLLVLLTVFTVLFSIYGEESELEKYRRMAQQDVGKWKQERDAELDAYKLRVEKERKEWKEYVNKDVVSALTAVELQTEEPDQLADKWSRILDVSVSSDKHGNPALALNNGNIRIVEPEDSRGEGLGALDVTVKNPEKLLSSAQDRGLKLSDSQVLICGVRFNLV